MTHQNHYCLFIFFHCRGSLVVTLSREAVISIDVLYVLISCRGAAICKEQSTVTIILTIHSYIIAYIILLLISYYNFYVVEGRSTVMPFKSNI